MENFTNEFNSIIINRFFDPTHPCRDITYLDEVIKHFRKSDPQAMARALAVQCVLEPGTVHKKEQLEALNAYWQNNATNIDVEAAIQNARTAAIFEDYDAFNQNLSLAESLLGFQPKVEGVEVKFTPHQTNPRTRVSALCEAPTEPDMSAKDEKCSFPIENVRLNTNNEIFEPPQFINETQIMLSTGDISNYQSAILLLRATYTFMLNPSATTSVVNEQALPFVRRVTESTNFSDLNFFVQARALYERSRLEIKDISELERGTLQLMKISKAFHSATPKTDYQKLLNTFHLVIPLPIDTVDDLAARKLVAMSDFANAIPFYEYLDRPLDVAVCLAATGANEKALELLKSPELAEDPKALLLQADLSSDADLWQKLWDVHNEPKAKLRLVHKAVADKDPEVTLTHLKDYLACQPSNYDALKLAASATMSLKQYDAAATYLRKCLAIKDDDTRGWSDLATALLQTDQPQPAHHAIKQAIRVNQNEQPDLPTYANFVALSAQLGLQDDVLVGLTRLAEAQGSEQYITRVGGVLPRLVSTYTKTEFKNTITQKQLLQLFSQSLPKVVSQDDALLHRLAGLVQIWAQKYQEGLSSLNKAVDLLLNTGGALDSRTKARLQLYSKDLISNLEKFGDEEGRIEGSKAFPGWSARKIVVEKKVASLIQ